MTDSHECGAECWSDGQGEAHHGVPLDDVKVDPVRLLEERVERLERRLQGVIENHGLWDGS